MGDVLRKLHLELTCECRTDYQVILFWLGRPGLELLSPKGRRILSSYLAASPQNVLYSDPTLPCNRAGRPFDEDAPGLGMCLYNRSARPPTSLREPERHVPHEAL